MSWYLYNTWIPDLFAESRLLLSHFIDNDKNNLIYVLLDSDHHNFKYLILSLYSEWRKECYLFCICSAFSDVRCFTLCYGEIYTTLCKSAMTQLKKDAWETFKSFCQFLTLRIFFLKFCLCVQKVLGLSSLIKR